MKLTRLSYLLTATLIGSSLMSTNALAEEDQAIESVRKFIESQSIDKQRANWKTSLKQPPKASFNALADYYWNLDTSKGKIKIKLMPGVAPMHVTSTIYLTELGFYDGISFHRVIPNFMAQGGCPLGNGMGSPGYKYGGEFSRSVKHNRPGLLSMANAGPGTDGSQFFITFVPTPHLDGKHTIFGAVVEGMDNVKALEKAGSPGSGKPKEPMSINKATISVEVPDLSADPIEALRSAAASVNKDNDDWRTQVTAPPKVGFAKDKAYFWNLETNKGPVKIKLMADVAPLHVGSTLYLTMAGYYDGLSFHRVIPNFMAQGGCPKGTGRGGPGYTLNGEFKDDVKHNRPGLLSMANAGPGTDGSQFFLTFVPTPHLDGRHTIFGEVAEGMDTLKTIEGFGSDGSGKTTEPITIVKASYSVEEASGK